ncbi:MAG TPA: hypothetical protein V6D20_18025, partial [Candidatus Obscuribacterales bacterium]
PASTNDPSVPLESDYLSDLMAAANEESTGVRGGDGDSSDEEAVDTPEDASDELDIGAVVENGEAEPAKGYTPPPLSPNHHHRAAAPLSSTHPNLQAFGSLQPIANVTASAYRHIVQRSWRHLYGLQGPEPGDELTFRSYVRKCSHSHPSVAGVSCLRLPRPTGTTFYVRPHDTLEFHHRQTGLVWYVRLEACVQVQTSDRTMLWAKVLPYQHALRHSRLHPYLELFRLDRQYTLIPLSTDSTYQVHALRLMYPTNNTDEFSLNPYLQIKTSCN